MTVYYQDDLVTLYHASCDEELAWLTADVLLVDPPYGIGYKSNSRRENLAASIAGDEDTRWRDYVLAAWDGRPALVFGTWRIPRPDGVQARLIWDTKGALGMGDTSLPWKPSDQEIYVLGHTTKGGFAGRRDSNVLVCAPVQSMARNGRFHPHEKPVALLMRLIDKCPAGVIADPFAGSGSLGVAAKAMGRRSVLVEVDEAYCEIAASRLAQDSLPFEQGA
jgi:hypothetical protein